MSGMMDALREAVVASGRWEKWRQAEEEGKGFEELTAERQGWLVRTGCRYVWAKPEVVAARAKLYASMTAVGEQGEDVVLGAIADVMRKYYRAFRVAGTLARIEKQFGRDQ